MNNHKQCILLITIAALYIIIGSGFSYADSTWSGTNTTGDASRTGNVAIGTTNPTLGKLTIESPASSTVSALRLLSGGSLPNNDVFIFGISGLTNGFRMRQDASSNVIYSFQDGNVGIGTTNPEAELHIDKPQINDSLYVGGVSNTNYSAINFRTDETSTAWVFAAGSVYPSWSLTGALNIYNQTGPIAFQTNGGNNRMVINVNGNVGIGTNDPGNYRLNINGGNVLVDGAGYIGLMLRGTSASDLYFFDSGAAVNKKWGIFRSDDGVTKFFSVNDSGTAAIQDNIMVMDHTSGNVGIGTSTLTYKLAVNGTIHAKEVKVETNWSDFVFEDNYNLPTLDKVESYIKENKHLPDVPSAKEVEEEGLSMSQMMAKQMQKIEELTLYVIEQNKQIEELKAKLTELEKNE